LEECLLLDEKNSKVFWKERPRKHFKRQSDWQRINNAHAGKEAFCTLAANGYLSGVIEKKIYLAHRVLWKMKYRKEPPPSLDHKDGIRTNNAWSNLRSATYSQNAQNRKNKPYAESGYKGVYKSRNKWMARLTVGYRRMYFGSYDTREEARAARVAAEMQFHGEFAA
jgi:hypothetical protein